MVKITYDSDGEIIQAYDSKINCPEPFIIVTDEVWTAAQGKKNKVINGELVSTPIVPDTAAFDAACEQFKAVCGQIGTAIGNADFKGGFDEYASFIQSAFAQSNPAQAALLASMWAGANEYAKYEGGKLGYGQPGWWYKCWNIERGV